MAKARPPDACAQLDGVAQSRFELSLDHDGLLAKHGSLTPIAAAWKNVRYECPSGLEVELQASTTYRSPSHSDAAILAAFEKVAAELDANTNQCTVTVVVMEGYQRDVRVQLAGIQRQPFAQHAAKRDSAAWASARTHIAPANLHVKLERKREQGDDEIQVWFDRDPADPVEVSRALTAVQRQFVPLNRAAAIERALGPEMAEFYRLREVGLSRLEALTQRLVTETHNYRMRVDTRLAEHKRDLDELFAKRRRALEARHEKRNAELKSREDDLSKLRKELDDRSARHARREQSRDLHRKISQRSRNLKLTPSTQRKRIPVHAIFMGLLVVSASLIAHSIGSPVTAREGAEFWLGLGRLPVGALGFALTAVFYIRWTDHWFRQHANQEFRLQQLALDVDRAGYATEMLMEWQEDKSGEMPAVMVDRLTAGLFTDQTTPPRARHPSEDATAAILRAASRVRVDIPGVGEVSLTGRQVRGIDKKLGKQGEKQQG